MLYELKIRVAADMLRLPLLERRSIANRSKARSFVNGCSWHRGQGMEQSPDPRQILQ